MVFTSSFAGLIPPATGLAPYAASKHALQCIAESLQKELKPFQIQVQTINPKAFLTGFNETMTESAFHWQDDTRNFIKRAVRGRAYFYRLQQGQKRPQLPDRKFTFPKSTMKLQAGNICTSSSGC